MRSRVFLAILLAAGLSFGAPRCLVAQADNAAVSFWDHRAGVRLLAFAPDGKTMATVQGNEQQTIALWDLATMTRKREWSDTGVVSELVLSPNGRLLAATTLVSENEDVKNATKPTVVVWDVTTGNRQHTFNFEDNIQIVRLAFTPDGKELVGADDSGSVRFWNLATGKQRAQVKLERGKNQNRGPSWLVFTPNLDTAVGVATDDQAARVWDVSTGKLKRSVPYNVAQGAYIALAPDGKALAIGTVRSDGSPNELKLWNLVTGKERRTWKEEDGPLYAVAFSPDGKLLASASAHTVRLRDVSTGKETATLEVPPDATQLAFSPNGKLLATFGRQQGARLWDVTNGKERLSPADEAERDRRETIYRKQQSRQQEARAAQASARNDAKKRLDPAGQSLLEEQVLRARRAEYALAMGQAQRASERWQFREARALLDSLRPAEGERDLRGFDWHYLHGKLPRETILFEHRDARLGPAAVSPDGEAVALVVPDPKTPQRGNLTLFDTRTGKQTGVLGACNFPVHALTFSPDGLLLAMSAGNPEKNETAITLWDTTRRRVATTLRGHSGVVSALQFAPDGRTLAAASTGGTLRLWDVQTGKVRHVLHSGKKLPFTSVAFSPDGRTLAAGAGQTLAAQMLEEEKTGVPVRLWDVETGKQKGELPYLKDATAIAFAPFTRHLATSHGGTVVLWDAASLRPIGSFQAVEGPLLFVDHGQQLLCNLALFDPLTGTERARWESTLVPFRPVTTAVPMKVGGVVYEEVPPAPRRPPVYDAQTLLAVAVSGSERVTAVVSDARTVRLVDFRVRDEPRRLDGPDDILVDLAFSRDGKSLLALGNELSRWDAITGRSMRSPFRLANFSGEVVPRVFQFKDRGQSVVSVDGVELPLADFVALNGSAILEKDQMSYHRALALSPDGKTLATAVSLPTLIDGKGEENNVEIITLRDTSTGKGRAMVKTGKLPLLRDQAAFSPDGRRLVTWAEDVVLWDETGKEVDRIRPPGRVWDVRFAADGKTPATLLVSDRDNSNVRLWDVATGEARATLRGLVGLTALKVSPDGKLIASGDEGGSVRLWDAQTGHLRLTLRGHRSAVDRLAFRPDSRAIAAAGSGVPVSLWSLDRAESRR
jgi:WD40 repeat protein